jgi:hypothetical protein
MLKANIERDLHNPGSGESIARLSMSHALGQTFE